MKVMLQQLLQADSHQHPMKDTQVLGEEEEWILIKQIDTLAHMEDEETTEDEAEDLADEVQEDVDDPATPLATKVTTSVNTIIHTNHHPIHCPQSNNTNNTLPHNVTLPSLTNMNMHWKVKGECTIWITIMR